MTLRGQLFEQTEKVTGIGKALMLVFGLLELELCGVAFALQSCTLGQPQALHLQRLQLRLQCFQFAQLLVMAVFQCLACVWGHGLHATGLLLQLREGFTGVLGRFKSGLAQTAVEAGVGEFFQQAAALVVVGLEKGGELALRQQHRAGELGQGQAEPGFEQFPELAFLAAGQQLIAVQVEQALVAGLQATVALFARALDLPAGAIAAVIHADKVHFGVAAGATAAQQVAFVATADLVTAVGHLVQWRHTVQPGCAAEQRQAQGVEEGAFASAGRPGDGEQAGAGQWLGGEVDGLFTGQ